MSPLYSIRPEAVAIVDAADKPAILERLSQAFAKSWNLDAAEVLEQLEERERLGSTGFGRGVAIPHVLGFGGDLVDAFLDDVTDRDEARHRAVAHHRQVADPPLGHQPQRLDEGGVGRDGYRRRSHHLADLAIKAQRAFLGESIQYVALGEDPGKLVALHHRQSADALFGEQLYRLADCRACGAGDDSAGVPGGDQSGDVHDIAPMSRTTKSNTIAAQGRIFAAQGVASTALRRHLARMSPPRRSPLDEPEASAHAWARYRRVLRWMALLTSAVLAVALAVLYEVGALVSIHFVIASILGIGVMMMLMAALMGLLFLSSGTGHDESVADPLNED